MKQNFFVALLFLSINAWAAEPAPGGMGYQYPVVPHHVSNCELCWNGSALTSFTCGSVGGFIKALYVCAESCVNETPCSQVCACDHLWFPTTPQVEWQECFNGVCWASSISLIGCSLFTLGTTIRECRRQ